MAVSHVQASSSRPPSAAGTASSNGGPAYHGLSHLDAYTEGELIGQGSFGVIHKVTRKSDGMVRLPCLCFSRGTRCGVALRHGTASSSRQLSSGAQPRAKTSD